MPQKNYPILKKICCFVPVNLAMKTLKRSNTQFGGYWPFNLDSVPEMKAENSNGYCSSNRQQNRQRSSDLEIRERIQDPPWQW